MATSAKMNAVAEDFGYQLAFLKSNKELWSVFNQAVNGGWSASRFVARVRATRWYRTTSEASRQAKQLQYSDPASFKAKQEESIANIAAMAGELGVALDANTRNRLGTEAYMMGYSPDQIRKRLVDLGKGRVTGLGAAGEMENAIRQTAYRNGVPVSDGWISSWIKRIQMGSARVEDAQQALREHYGKQIAPGFEKELAAGQDLYDLASPYMQSMAKTLEINPADLDLWDPTIRKALASSNDKDGTVGSIPLWQFERDLRKDRRWLQTNGAREELDKTTRTLAQMFGKAV